MAYSKNLAAGVNKYLKDNNYGFDFDEENGFFIVKETIGETELEGLMMLQVVEDCVLFRCMTSMKIMKGKLNLVAEYLNRVNDMLINGCFVLDYDEGKVSFKAYIGCFNDTVTEEQLTDVFASCVLAYEAFWINLEQVAAGQVKDIKSLFTE